MRGPEAAQAGGETIFSLLAPPAGRDRATAWATLAATRQRIAWRKPTPVVKRLRNRSSPMWAAKLPRWLAPNR